MEKKCSYHLEHNMMLRKCFGCYRVTAENAKNNNTMIYDLVTTEGPAGFYQDPPSDCFLLLHQNKLFNNLAKDTNLPILYQSKSILKYCMYNIYLAFYKCSTYFQSGGGR